MKSRILLTLLLVAFLPALSNASGLGPWQFGMSKPQVASFKQFGPYKSFSNGDLETYNWRFHGHKANVQFFFLGERLRRIGVYLYEGTDPKGGIPSWRIAYDALHKDFGSVSTPDIRVGSKSDPLNPDVIAIGEAMNADVTGESRLLPGKQPANMHVFARGWTGIVQGKKWYYIAVFYDQNT
jgi:hypothetical protein